MNAVSAQKDYSARAKSNADSYAIFRPRPSPHASEMKSLYRPIQLQNPIASRKSTPIITDRENLALANTITTSASSATSRAANSKPVKNMTSVVEYEKLKSMNALPPLIETSTENVDARKVSALPKEFQAQKSPVTKLKTEPKEESLKTPIVVLDSAPLHRRKTDLEPPASSSTIFGKKYQAAVTATIGFLVTFAVVFILLALMNPLFVQKKPNSIEKISVDQRPNLAVFAGALAAAMPFIWKKVNERY
jgi:hypothetical protein